MYIYMCTMRSKEHMHDVHIYICVRVYIYMHWIYVFVYTRCTNIYRALLRDFERIQGSFERIRSTPYPGAAAYAAQQVIWALLRECRALLREYRALWSD